MMHALLFVSMGVEARCRPSKSTAHCRHMKRQPFLCNGCPRRNRRHCHCHRHLRRHRQLRCHCRCCCGCRRKCPLQLPLPLAIAIAVAVDHCRCHLCRVAISHCCCRCPCCWPLPSPSLLAIAVAIAVGHHHCHAVGHFWELLPWCGKNCIQPIEAKNAHLILFCSYSGRRIDQSRMTDQVLSGNGQHQHWAASSKQWAASEGSGRQQGGSRGAERWRRWLTMGGVVLFGCWSISHWQMAFVMMCWMW